MGDDTDVNMAADCSVRSLYNLAAFTTVRNCDVYKSEFRSLPNAVQCDVYRAVGIYTFLYFSFQGFGNLKT